MEKNILDILNNEFELKIACKKNSLAEKKIGNCFLTKTLPWSFAINVW